MFLPSLVQTVHGLFVVANMLLIVISSHLSEMRHFCQRINEGAVQFATESARAAALKEHTGILHEIMNSSTLISATMGSSAAMSLLSVILILWYIVAGDAPLDLLLSVFDCKSVRPSAIPASFHRSFAPSLLCSFANIS